MTLSEYVDREREADPCLTKELASFEICWRELGKYGWEQKMKEEDWKKQFLEPAVKGEWQLLEAKYRKEGRLGLGGWPSQDCLFRAIHRFSHRGGERIVDGNGYWPDLLRVELDREKMWGLVRDLLFSLEHGEEKIVLALVGELKEETE